jgi:predicted nucleic acid-binding protein
VILADASVWVDYLRNASPEMEKRLGLAQIAMHPFIVAEIALGSSKGIGLTDAHLIASCLLTPGTQLWTRDGAMDKVARGLRIAVNLR